MLVEDVEEGGWEGPHRRPPPLLSLMRSLAPSSSQGLIRTASVDKAKDAAAAAAGAESEASGRPASALTAAADVTVAGAGGQARPCFAWAGQISSGLQLNERERAGRTARVPSLAALVPSRPDRPCASCFPPAESRGLSRRPEESSALVARKPL